MEIARNTCIGDIMAHCPQCADVFLDAGMHCVMCGAAAWETVEQGAASHGMDKEEIDALVKELKICADKFKKGEQEEEKKKLKICLPLKEKKMKDIEKAFEEAKDKCDIFEVWLDELEDLDIKKLVSACPKELICVCKGKEEKGSFKGSEEERVNILKDAIEAGADYIDIGIHTDKGLIEGLVKNIRSRPETCSNSMSVDFGVSKGDAINRVSTAKIIISHHDWNRTPNLTEMMEKVEEIRNLKPDYIKIVATANKTEDNVQMIYLAEMLKEDGDNFIVMCMGEKGKLSRVVTPMIGGEWMYAPIEKEKASADGQLTADELKMIWGKLSL